MQIHAYRVELTLLDSVDTSSQEFQATLESNRQAVRRKIAQFGGDPLPNEQVLVGVSASGQVVLLWRSLVPPARGDLLKSISDYAAGLTLVTAWRLAHHRCGNGSHSRCGEWQVLMES